MIWVDISAGVLQRAGIARYARELACALLDSAPPGEASKLGFYSCGTTAPPAFIGSAPFRSSRLSARQWRALLLAGHAVRRRILPGLSDFALFHATDVAYPYAADEQIIVTVHDLSVLRYPQLHRPANRIFQTIMLHLLRRRRHPIIAVSRFTARELETLLGIEPERITVIYPGVAPIFWSVPSAEEMTAVRQKYAITGRFALSVGTQEPRKNLATLVTVFEEVAPPDVELLLVGARGWGRLGLRPGLSARARVRWLGYVPDAELRCLYRQASVFVYPSLYEGFGSPVAEALACGTPVICSRQCGVAEVASQAAELTIVGKRAELADALAAGLDRLRAGRGIPAALESSRASASYRETARLTWRVYGRMAGALTVSARRPWQA